MPNGYDTDMTPNEEAFMEKTAINDPRLKQEDYLMTDQEVADLAKVPVNTVRYWRQMGQLPFVKVGRHPRVWLSVFTKTFHKPGS